MQQTDLHTPIDAIWFSRNDPGRPVFYPLRTPTPLPSLRRLVRRSQAAVRCTSKRMASSANSFADELGVKFFQLLCVRRFALPSIIPLKINRLGIVSFSSGRTLCPDDTGEHTSVAEIALPPALLFWPLVICGLYRGQAFSKLSFCDVLEDPIPDDAEIGVKFRGRSPVGGQLSPISVNPLPSSFWTSEVWYACLPRFLIIYFIVIV